MVFKSALFELLKLEVFFPSFRLVKKNFVLKFLISSLLIKYKAYAKLLP